MAPAAMRPSPSFGACLAACLTAAACADVVATPDMGGEEIRINEKPTGTVQQPSLCEREMADVRVTTGGVTSFSWLWHEDHYEAAYADRGRNDINVVHLARDGHLLEPPLVLEQTVARSALPTIAAASAGFVVAWQEEDPLMPHVRAHALDQGGRPAGRAHVIAYGRSVQMRPVVARSPLGTAISWMDQAAAPTSTRDIGDSATYVGLLDEAARLRSDVPRQPISPGSRVAYPWLAGDGDSLAVLWSGDHSGVVDPYFGMVGETLGVDRLTNVRGAVAPNVALLGRLVRTDVGYLAAWEDLRSGDEEIYMSLLDPDGNRYAGGLVEEPGTGNANWPHMAWTGSTAGIVYYQFRGGRPQIFMTFIDQNGQRVGGAADAQISNTTVWARFPDVQWTGSEFGVLWLDARGGEPDLYFNRVACQRPPPI
jgi:hypothetical protein